MKYILLTLFGILFLVSLIVISGCNERDYNYVTTYHQDSPGIPTLQYNNIVGSFNVSLSNNGHTVRLNTPGIINPVTGEPIDLVANRNNIYVLEDGKKRFFTVKKVGSANILPVDLVFLVDNSASMGTEADKVAEGIAGFAQELASRKLDVRFGCVGYNDWGDIDGALNLTSADSLELYLNRGQTGKYRTRGFVGPDSAELRTVAEQFADTVGGENGVVAVFYADSFFTWRAGAQRHYINLTDEPTQPYGVYRWSTMNFCNTFAGKIDVHTVFSADTVRNNWYPLVNERPWKMSECTGGTAEFIDKEAVNLDLRKLQIVNILENSYLIEFNTLNPDGTHVIQVYIFDEHADGLLTLIDVKYEYSSGGF